MEKEEEGKEIEIHLAVTIYPPMTREDLMRELDQVFEHMDGVGAWGEFFTECPKCGAKIEIVAYSSKYVIYGCMEHRDYDRVVYYSTRAEERKE